MSRATLSRRWRCLILALMLGCGPCAALADDTEEADAPIAQGRELYLRQCARCHQRDGRGIDNLYPNLRDSADLWTRRERPVEALLAGRSGPLSLGELTYNNVMPNHGFLGNEVIAATLNYLREAWGPGGKPYTTEEVAAVRLKLMQDHPGSYSPLPDVSPLEEMGAVQYVTSEGPPMSVSDFERARRIYYGRCTGCHGVLRQGLAGSPLTPELMRERGTAYLQAVINYGSSAGMPNWGTSDQLDPEDITRLALFLQHPVPQPPDMTLREIRDGWQQPSPLPARPATPEHDYDLDQLFVVLLHDTGEIMLIDGPSRAVITRVAVGRSPHLVTASASGRYLYVICRDGTLSQVDLFADPPVRSAFVRVGFEARAVDASRYAGYEDRYVMAGAYWPPQLLLLDGRTLEPLRLVSTRSFASGTDRYHPEPRVEDIAGSVHHPEFINQIKETGHVYLFRYDDLDPLQIRDLETARELRAGSYSLDARYYLTPADSNAVSVLDVEEERIVAEIPARVFGGGRGTRFRDPDMGPVWAVASMVSRDVQLFGTDPEGHPDQAWREVGTLRGPDSGSLFLASHPASKHLWMDTPLAADPESAQQVAVFDIGHLDKGFRRLPVARWAGLEGGPQRVLQPTYDASGSEVWLTVWNPQNLGAAVVVVDDATLEPRAVIRDAALTTPTRIYSVAALRRAVAPQTP